MTGRAATRIVEERGVYWEPYLKHGRRVLYAVKSDGERLRGLVLLDDTDEDDAIEFLWRNLDAEDPVPKLELVRDEPPHLIDLVHRYVDSVTFERLRHDHRLRDRVFARVRTHLDQHKILYVTGSARRR